MNRIVSLVRWLCRQLTLLELFIAVIIILEVLDDSRSDIKCKDYFQTQYPNYRKFHVDPEPPLSERPVPKTTLPSTDWKDLLKSYQLKKGKELKPVKRHDPSTCVLNSIRCPNCNAPGRYIYYNDGKKRLQLRCKVCYNLFQANKHHRPSKAKYWCPHCNNALYVWKKSKVMTIHKCPNDKCPCYLTAKNNLNRKEKKLQKLKSSQFKLRYQYREYHFDPKDLVPASPQDVTSIDRIHNSLDILGLVLTLNVSYGHSARTTAHMLKNIFCIQLSYQTVLNYTNAAAVLCHKFNIHHKGPIDPYVSGDETYIRVTDKWNYTWFTIGSHSRAIHAYHLSDSRQTRHALITLKETIRTLPDNETINFIADANPAYDAATLAINADSDGTPLQRRKVVGLKNVDEESSQFRAHKQIIERLNRTYKFHTRARCGFKNLNGAVALTVLFVTHYNFLRPHCSLGRKCPIPIDDLNNIETIQGRWSKILEKATLI